MYLSINLNAHENFGIKVFLRTLPPKRKIIKQFLLVMK